MHSTLRFKHGSDRIAWPKADRRLAVMVEFVQRWLVDEAGVYHLMITSFYRPEDPGSVHAYYRGADIRTRDMPVGVADRLSQWLNELLYYGTKDERSRRKRVALWHNVDSEGAIHHTDHIHLQVCNADDYVSIK